MAFPKKLLLMFEFSLAFGIPFMFLLYGLVFGPFMLLAGLPMLDYAGSLAIVVTTVGGCLGLSASLQLLSLQIYPSVRIASPKQLMARVVAGIVALAIFWPLTPELHLFVSVAMLLPIPVVAHLLYLNRHYLFRVPGHVA